MSLRKACCFPGHFATIYTVHPAVNKSYPDGVSFTIQLHNGHFMCIYLARIVHSVTHATLFQGVLDNKCSACIMAMAQAMIPIEMKGISVTQKRKLMFFFSLL
jgi:hypothetical protein